MRTVRSNNLTIATATVLLLLGCSETATTIKEEEDATLRYSYSLDVTHFDGDFSDLPDPPKNCGQALMLQKKLESDYAANKRQLVASAFFEEGSQSSAATQAIGWKGDVCSFACWSLSAVGCGSICIACTNATAYTIGGLAIPCKIAILAGCGLVSGAAAICDRRLCSRFGSS